MTDQEVQAYLGKPVRLTMADGTTLAGVLEAGEDHGHGHHHYTVTSDPVREGGSPVSAVVHGAAQIAWIDDASSDPAATP